MPDPYPNATFRQTRLARIRLGAQQLNVNDAIHVIKNYHAATPGFNVNQRWFYGETQNHTPLRVLVEDHQPGDVQIITVDFTEQTRRRDT